MRGNYVPRKAGWDCHGLPVELEVEKELGISSKAEIEAYGIAEFNERCRESVLRYVEDWNRLTERIGFWIDLDDPYVTMTNEYIESVWWSLRRSGTPDRLYEGHKVVPYCPRCGTALSSHEVAQGYADVEDPSVYVRFPVIEAPPTDAIPEPAVEPGDSLLVWTTTPWTLISNAAVAVGEDIEYVRVRAGDEVLVVARDLVERVLGEDAEVLATSPARRSPAPATSRRSTYIPDYGPHGHTVLLGDFVTHRGRHRARPHRDRLRRGRLPARRAVRDHAPEPGPRRRHLRRAGHRLRRADRQGGRPGDRRGAARVAAGCCASEVYEHSYPHCWRCGTPLLYYAKASWYIRTTEVRDRMLAENEPIGWRPEHVKHGRFGTLAGGQRRLGALARALLGHAAADLGVRGADCDERFCAGLDRRAARARRRGARRPAPPLHRRGRPAAARRAAATMRRVEEVIDTWYDSGAMPFAQFHYPFEGEEEFEQRFPADYICEAQDQTRGWFYSLLAESTLLFDQTSYRNCVCLGLILDAEGQKMSKSRGNVVDPWQVIDRHGADAFRWYLLTSPAALGRLPLLRRDGRRVGAPVPADAVEHVLRSSSSTRTRRASGPDEHLRRAR